MLFLGVGVAIVGATARAVGLSPSQIGYLVAAQNVGFAIAVVTGGALSDRYPKPSILATGLVILAGAFALLYRNESFAVNLVVMLFMGVGMGTAEAVTDALLLEMHTENEGRLVTINHFFVSIGSVAITLYLMALELDWSSSLFQVAAALAVLAVIAALLAPPANVTPKAGGGALRNLSTDIGVLLLVLAGIGSIGIGVGSAGVITTFANELRGISVGSAQIMLALFLGGLAVGRIAVGLLGRLERPGRIAAVAAVGAFATSVVFYLLPLTGVALFVAASVMGLTVAPLLPLTIAVAGLRYRSVAGTAMGMVKLAIPVGGIVIPGLIGLVSDLVSFSAALYLFPASALLVVASTILAERRAS